VDLTIAAPLNWVESVGKLHFPSKADRRLQELMDRNNEGRLDQSEREALEALAELSEQLSLVRRLCRFWASGHVCVRTRVYNLTEK
jgi:hypothetical protein